MPTPAQAGPGPACQPAAALPSPLHLPAMVMEPHDPPPPYSETWTEAASVAGAVGHSPIIGTGSDDASLATPATTTAPSTTSAQSSSGGNVIYTPPDTPTPELQHTAVPTGIHVRHQRDPSAQAYFDSRPVVLSAVSDGWLSKSSAEGGFKDDADSTHNNNNNINTNHHVNIHVRVSDTTTPADLPFPSVLSAATTTSGVSNVSGSSRHDITEQDWQTFVNFLIPDHVVRSNAGLISRKIQDENGNTSYHGHNNDGNSTSNSPCSGGRQGELTQAQLDQIRSAFPDHALAERGRVARDAVWEWNDGFFAPRGVRICLKVAETPTVPAAAAGKREDGLGRETMPGSHALHSRDTAAPVQGQQCPSSGSRPGSGSGSGFGFGSSRWNPFNQSPQALRLGPVRIEGNRVSIGNSFEADKSGVRWNGISLEDMLAQQGLGSLPGLSSASRGGGARHPGPAAWGGRGSFPGGPFGGGPFDRGRGGGGRGGWGWSEHGQQHQHQHHSHQHDHHGAGGVPNHDQHRSQSRASHGSTDDDSESVASSTSSTSSHSAPSIGSLPDLDNLRDSQLPVVKQSISAWLAHPEQPITRDMVRAAKADIKSAKRSLSQQQQQRSAQGSFSPAWASSSSSSRLPQSNVKDDSEHKFRSPPPTYDEVQAIDYQALREEVRVLMTAFEGLKRGQKHRRKCDKKQRRAARKAARKEKKKGKKAARVERRAARDERRKESRAQRHDQRDRERHEHARGHEQQRDAERRRAQHERDQADLGRSIALEEQRRAREEQLKQQRDRNEVFRQQQLEERREQWSQRGHHGQRGGRGGGGWSPFGGFGRADASVAAAGPFAAWGVVHPPHPPHSPPGLPQFGVLPAIPQPYHHHSVQDGNHLGSSHHGGPMGGGYAGGPGFAISGPWPSYHVPQSAGVEPLHPQHHQRPDLCQPTYREGGEQRSTSSSGGDGEPQPIGIQMADNDSDITARISGLSIDPATGGSSRHDPAEDARRSAAQIADRVQHLTLDQTQQSLGQARQSQDRAAHITDDTLERAMAALLHDPRASNFKSK